MKNLVSKYKKESLEFDDSFQPLAEGVERSLNCYKTHLNNNLLIIGPPGSGKSRGVIIPTILGAKGSMVISDPKGALYKKYSDYLANNGYEVKRISLINPGESTKYNPLSYVNTSSEIKALANIIVYTKPGNSHGSYDPFWDQSTEILLASLIAYIKETDEIPEVDKNIHTVINLLSELSCDEDNIEDCLLSIRMFKHADKMRMKGKESFATRQYNKFLQTPRRTICTILTTTHVALSVFDTDEMLQLLESNELDIESIGERKTALFVEVSDTDRSLDGVASVLYTQLFNTLCKKADKNANCELSVPVRFILDDFATNVKVPNFDSILANIRARKISAILAIQSESQLTKQYPENYETIIECCDTILYLGVNSLASASSLSERADISVKEALLMKPMTCWVFEHGKEPRFCNTINLDKYMCNKKLIVDTKIGRENK